MRMLAEDLVTSIKRRSLVPISQQTFQDSDLLALANEEMSINLVPEIQRVREDLFLRSKLYSVTASKSKYVLPERAVGNALKAVALISSGVSYEIPRLDVSKTFGGDDLNRADSFYLEDNYIVLNPTPSSGDSMQVWFYQRPNQILATSSCAKVTGVSSAGGTTTLTVDTNLTGSLSVGDKVDVLSGLSPFILWGEDAVITAITASTIEVATTSVDDETGAVPVVVGDYVCPAKYANIPMIPQEFHPVLAQMVTCRLLEALGDLNKLQASLAKLQEMNSNAAALIANRVENAVEFFNNSRGFMSFTGRVNRRSAR